MRALIVKIDEWIEDNIDIISTIYGIFIAILLLIVVVYAIVTLITGS